jgi:hypothetical protein
VWWKEEPFSPSQQWQFAGPIIGREGIWLRGPHDATSPDGSVVIRNDKWHSSINHRFVQCAATPLVAAMRCFVCSVLGETVHVPTSIIKELAE